MSEILIVVLLLTGELKDWNTLQTAIFIAKIWFMVWPQSSASRSRLYHCPPRDTEKIKGGVGVSEKEESVEQRKF